MSLFFGISQSLPNASVWDGLIHYWNMNQNTGTVVIDSVNTANNGTLSSSSAWNANGKNGSAFYIYNFHYINYGALSLFTSGDAWAKPYSISAWIKAATAPVTGVIPILCNFDSAATGTVDFYINSGNIYFALFYQNNTQRCYVNTTAAGTQITTTNWYHIVATYAGDKNANNMKIYVNGGSNVAGAITNNLTYNNTHSTSMYTNRRLTTTSYDNQGIIDEIGFWNRAISQSEAQTLYNSGNGYYY